MSNNCQYNGIHVSLPPKNNKQNALDMAKSSDMWFSGEQARNMTVDLMCQFADQENEELKKQVSALALALETQNRENQPYIKELEKRIDMATSIMNDVMKGLTGRTIHLVQCFLRDVKTAPGTETGRQ